MKNVTLYRNQQGAALVVGLILMVVITVLAISGMTTATTELAMARNDQNYENAFQEAEAGLDIALTQEPFNSFANVTVTHSNGYNESVATVIAFERSTHATGDSAFSIGSGISAHHFVATSNAVSARVVGTPTDRDSTATHSQAFFVIGPGNQNQL
jgi:type IV pilus assembly protein PilX